MQVEPEGQSEAEAQGVRPPPEAQMWFVHVEPVGQPESATQMMPQMPLTQSSPVAHCALAVQLWEETTQAPWTQRRPVPHEASVVHAVRHWPTRHRCVDEQSPSDVQRPGVHWEWMHHSVGAQSVLEVQEVGGAPSTQVNWSLQWRFDPQSLSK